ncbi:MAG: thiamine diphosphokinase [Lachnospiraceae bacterium]|nr:thiamine diphosphokinase [Lachnospiraceae bacterium]
MSETLIISGGSIDIDFACNYLKNHSFEHIIAVDGGLESAMKMNLVPGYIVGDFDTVSKDILDSYRTNPNIVFRQFQPEKDFTDTQSAINLAVELGTLSITIFGGIGTRMDHSLANIQLLQMPLEQGIEAVIINSHNRIRLLGVKRKEIELKKSEYKYVSIIPMSQCITGLTLTGMKYPLRNYEMYIDQTISLGVSNEIIEEPAAVKLKSGKIILIESRD